MKTSNGMKNILQNLKLITLAIIFSFGLSYVYAWTAPTSQPPGGNTPAPLNTSATDQYKGGGAGTTGGLGIEGLIRGYSNAIFDGSVGIGTTDVSAAKLTVSGAMKIGNSSNVCNTANGGTIRHTGTDFEGCVGGVWKSLTAGTGSTAPAPTGMQVFASSGTFIVPDGVTSIKVSVAGGGAGGGGGGAAASNDGSWLHGGGGGGGGGGGWAYNQLTVVSGTSYYVTVGTGGAGGASSGTSGTASVFSTLVGYGGAGGVGGTSGNSSTPQWGGFGGAGGGGGGTTGGSTGGAGGSGGNGRHADQGGQGGTAGTTGGTTGAGAAGAGGNGSTGSGFSIISPTGGAGGSAGKVVIEW